MRTGLRGLALLVGLFVLVPAAVWPQTETGRITGVVTDQSGGVLPGVNVTLRSVERGTTRTTVTDSKGAYVFASLVPGNYEVTPQLTGFSGRPARTNVAVGSTAEVSLQMAVGGQTEEVTVVGEATAPINTTTQDIQTVVRQQQIAELPTITRNPYDLVALSGNISQQDLPQGSIRGVSGFSINGQRATSTNVLLDGASNNDEFTGSVGQAVPLDSVQEFSVITSNFSAQYGRASGGIVNVVTRSGTNDFHGSLYDFFRNDALSTATFDQKARGEPKGTFSRHQGGFSLGGPIVRDKLHFFVSGEYIRVRGVAPQTALVPTPELISRMAPASQAFFNQFQLAAPIASTIPVSAITGVTPGGPFSALPADFPAFGVVSYNVPQDSGAGLPRNEYQTVARLDWSPTTSDQAYLRFAWQNQSFETGAGAAGVGFSPWQGFNTDEKTKNFNVVGSLTHVFSNQLTSQTKVVYNQVRDDQPLGAEPPVPGMYMRNSRTSIGGVPVALPGYLPFNPGAAIPFGGPQKFLQAYEDLNYTLGRHELRFGGSFVRIMDDRTFGAYESSVQTLGGSLGEALDNLMLGQLIRFEGAVNPNGAFPGQTITLPVSPPDFSRQNRYSEWAAYFNDTWSLTPRFRLNLGVRYEYYGVQHNVNPSLDSNFYYGGGANQFQQIQNGQVFIADQSPVGGLWAPDKNNFAPRVGFAWDVTGDGKTSLRAGYGIGYERNFGNVTFNVIQNPPNYAVIAITPADTGAPLPIFSTNAGPLSGTGSKTLPPTSLRWVDQNVKNAYAHFWSVSLQRQLLNNVYGEIEYTGSAGRDLYSLENPNRVGTAAVYLGSSSLTQRLNTQYTNLNRRANNGRSNYNGVTVGLDARQLGPTGLSVTARYTLGYAKDNLSTTFSESLNNFNLGLTDPFNPSLDYGWADFDVRHRVAAGFIWQIPIAKNSTGAARLLAKGWELSGLFTAQSGAPFTEFDCTNAITTCARLAQVAAIGGYQQTPVPGQPNTFTYLDLGNQAPGVGTIANPITGTTEVWQGTNTSNMMARSSLRRPGRWNLDAILSKRLFFTNRVALNLRLEVYNVFNHANLYVVDDATDISSATQVFAVRGFTSSGFGTPGDGQRRIQLAAKVEF